LTSAERISMDKHVGDEEDQNTRGDGGGREGREVE
jgi:hypothetical protein